MPARSPLTTVLIVLNIAAFLFEYRVVGAPLLGGRGSREAFVAAGALVPMLVTRGAYWRLITGAFLHGSAMHLLVNMYSLHVLGRFAETLTGARSMAIVYGVSLVGSSLAVVFFSEPDAVTVGASGAIFGLFGALFAVGFRLGRPGMRLVRANIGVLAVNLFITFAVPGISAAAHVGGLVVGFVVMIAIFAPPPPVPPPVPQVWIDDGR